MPRSDTWFKPGQSGNPKGRPPGRCSLREMVRRELLKPVKGAKDGRTTAEEWARRLVAGAIDNDGMLNVLRWLEGAQPSADNLALERTNAALDDIETILAEEDAA